MNADLSPTVDRAVNAQPLTPSDGRNEAGSLKRGSASALTAAALLPRRRRLLAVALLLWFLLILLGQAPAQLLPALLRSPLPQLQLGAVTGSFWHGRAVAAQWHDGNRIIALGAMEWRIAPWSLLLLQPRAQLSAEYGEQFGAATVTTSPFGSLELRTVRIALPASSLRALAPLPLDGTVTLQMEHLSLDGDGGLTHLDGELQWQRAAWQWEHRWLPLGDYRCRLSSGELDQLSCKLDGGSAAKVSGVVDADLAQRRYRIDSELSLSSDLPAALRDNAGLLLGGRSSGGDSWRIEQEGGW